MKTFSTGIRVAGFFGFAILNILVIILLVPQHPGLSGIIVFIGCVAGAYTSSGGVTDRSFWWWIAGWLILFFVFYFIQRGEWS